MQSTMCCRNCNRRVVGCHSNCGDYAEFVSQNNILKKRKLEERKINDYFQIKARQMSGCKV